MANTPKILIVDDDNLILQVTSEVLADDGYEIFFAKDGQEALDSVTKYQPDIIILDIMMPVMNGIDVCKHLKSNRATAAIPIVMLTARTTISDKFDGFDAGADEYISKPFDPQILRNRVATLVRRLKKK